MSRIFKDGQMQEMMLNTKDLIVNGKAQRELQPWKVKKIVKEFNPLLVNPIKVSFRNGKYYVFDGQHTMEALKEVSNGNCPVRCVVYYGLTEADEAELFIQQSGVSSKVSAADKMRVRYNYGGEAERDMVRAAELAGVRVDFTGSEAVNKCTAVKTLMDCYKILDRKAFIDMLVIIREAWDGVPGSFSKEVLKGMTRFFSVYYRDFKDKDLISSLSRIRPVTIAREGRGAIGAQNGTSYARFILSLYNNGRRTRRLEDRL